MRSSVSKEVETITALADVVFIYFWYFLFARKDIESLVAFSKVEMLLTIALLLPITLEFINSAISASVYYLVWGTTRIEY